MSDPQGLELVEVFDTAGNRYRLPAKLLRQHAIPSVRDDVELRLRSVRRLKEHLEQNPPEVVAKAREFARHLLERIDREFGY